MPATMTTPSALLRPQLGLLILGLLAAALLSACGGGDGFTVPDSTTTTTPTHVATTFVTSASTALPSDRIPAGSTVRYLVQGPSLSYEGVTTAFTQDTLGAMTSFDNNSLAATNGTYAVQEFMGDATFAQGRWTKGLPTLNGVTLSASLTGTDSTAVHYLVMQDLPSFTNGTYTCGQYKSDLRATGLTYSGTTDVAPADPMLIGGVVPYATISVSAGVATVALKNVIVTGAGLLEEGYPNQTLTFTSPSAGPVYLDGYQVGNEGAAFVLGRDTNAANITLGMAYRRAMSNGARYKGMVSIVCKP